MKTIIRKIESRESLTDDDIGRVLEVLEIADIVPEDNILLHGENRLLKVRLDAEIAHSQRLIREGTEDHVKVQRVLDALSYLGKDSDEDVIARVRKAVEK